MIDAKIKAALIRFNGAIKSADGAALSAALTELEALLGAHREELHPQLRHYLEGRSYAKALAWLGVDDPQSARPASPPGGCGRSHS
jgi:hypothetical protein